MSVDQKVIIVIVISLYVLAFYGVIKLLVFLVRGLLNAIRNRKQNVETPGIKKPEEVPNIKKHNEKIADPEKRESITRWQEGLDEIWTGNPKKIIFDYESYNGDLSRRTVDLTHVLVSESGQFYFYGYCRDRKEPRTFKLDSIQSTILCGFKSFQPLQFIEEELGIIVDWEQHADGSETESFINAIVAFKNDFAELENNAWKVVMGELSIALHRSFKNGKMHKMPKVQMYFNADNVTKKWTVTDGDHHRSFFKPEDGIKMMIQESQNF